MLITILGLKRSTIASPGRVSIYILVVSSVAPVVGYQIITIGFFTFIEQDESAANSSLPDLVNASLAPAVLICFGSQVSLDRDVREDA